MHFFYSQLPNFVFGNWIVVLFVILFQIYCMLLCLFWRLHSFMLQCYMLQMPIGVCFLWCFLLYFLFFRCWVGVCHLPRSHCNFTWVISVGGYLFYHAVDSGHWQCCEYAPTQLYTRVSTSLWHKFMSHTNLSLCTVVLDEMANFLQSLDKMWNKFLIQQSLHYNLKTDFY